MVLAHIRLMTPPETLRTARLVLRKPTREDATLMFAAYGQDHEVAHYVTWRPHTCVSDSEAVIDRFLGYVLARRQWGYGFMAEAVTPVVDLAFTEPSVFRVGAVCDVDNLRSARVLEKAGFEREGILRSWAVHPNISSTPRDCYSYSKTRNI